jgi:spermidine/putrescine-binding protein
MSDFSERDFRHLSVDRRTLLRLFAVSGVAGTALVDAERAIAQTSDKDIDKIVALVQGGPVGDIIKSEANSLFAKSHPNTPVELLVSSNAVTYPRMLAQRSNPIIAGGMFNDLFSLRGTTDKMWEKFNPAFVPNAAQVPSSLMLPGGEGITIHQTPFGIAYNPDRVEAPKSWADLWKPEYKGRVSMWDSYFDAYAMAGVVAGKGPSVEEGIKAWVPHRANVGAWVKSPIAEVDLLHRGEVWLAPHWGAWAEQARIAGKKVAFTVPKEGATLWSNQMHCSVGFSPKATETIQRYLNTWLSEPCQTAWLTKAFISPAVSTIKIPDELKSNAAVVSPEAASKLFRLDAQHLGANFAAIKAQIDQTLKG